MSNGVTFMLFSLRLKSVFLFSLVLLFGCATDTSSEDKTVYFTVLHTNDHHGHFWRNQKGEYGMAARQTLINQIRQEVESQGNQVLLFSGGDINTGVPESDLQDAEPDFKGMNRLGYDAMAVGNHEFDNSRDILEKQRRWANFPFLSANIYVKKTGKRLFQPYEVFNVQGVKIAVIGLTTEDTAKLGNPDYVSDLEFRDPKVEAKQVINTLKTQVHPDLIFAVTHMGHYDNGLSGINAPGDVTLARSLPYGALNMVIGGHSQEAVCMEKSNVRDRNYQPGDTCIPDQQNGTYIVQAHEWGKYVGRADFAYQNGKLTLLNYQLIPVNMLKKTQVNGQTVSELAQAKIPEDKAMLDFLTPYQERGGEELTKVLATSDGKLEGDRNQVRFRQTNLGHLIALAHKERTNADFSVMNSGGVRDSISAGKITYKDVLKVQPFSNTVGYVDMRGSEVLDYLNQVATKPVDSGAYAQFAGISMQVSLQGVHHVMIGGKPIELNRTYRFSIPSYNAAGGDGYPVVNQHPGYVDTGFVDADVLSQYLRHHTPIHIADYQPGDAIQYR